MALGGAWPRDAKGQACPHWQSQGSSPRAKALILIALLTSQMSLPILTEPAQCTGHDAEASRVSKGRLALGLWPGSRRRELLWCPGLSTHRHLPSSPLQLLSWGVPRSLAKACGTGVTTATQV